LKLHLNLRILSILLLLAGISLPQDSHFSPKAKINEDSGSKIKIENAWMISSSEGMNSAMFFDIVNFGDEQDILYKAEYPLAEWVQIQRVVKKGRVTMIPNVKDVVVEPNSTFSFKPRDHYILLRKVRKPLKEGDNEEVILYFRDAGMIKVITIVKEYERELK